jgi:hypothetical protein
VRWATGAAALACAAGCLTAVEPGAVSCIEGGVPCPSGYACCAGACYPPDAGACTVTGGTTGGASSTGGSSTGGSSTGGGSTGGGSTGGSSTGAAGGSAGTGGADAGGCLIAGTPMSARAPNRYNPCQICDPRHPSVWTSFPDGGDPDGGCGSMAVDGGTLDYICAQGICACPQGYQRDAAGRPVDLCTDDDNCGAPGNACTGARGCFGGVCQPPPSFPLGGRQGAAAVEGSDGQIYLLGGQAPDQLSLPYVDAFDPRNGSWRQQPPLPSASWVLQASSDGDGGIYAMGGQIGPDLSSGCWQSVTRFDLSTTSWQDAGQLPFPVCAGAAELVNGQIYLIAGNVFPDGLLGGPTANGQTFRLAPGWPSAAPQKYSTYSAAVTTTRSGQLVSCGGDSAAGIPESWCDAWDPLSDAGWTSLPSGLPAPRAAAAAATLWDGRLGVFGGLYPCDGGPGQTASYCQAGQVEIYSFDAGSWSVSPDDAPPVLPVAVAYAAAVRGQDGRIYLLGGQGIIDGGAILSISNMQVLDRSGSRWESSP